MKDSIFSQIDFGPIQAFLDNDDLTDLSYSNNGQVFVRSLSKGEYKVNIPEINQLGIESPKNQYSLNITFENQDGTFAEYSIDDVKRWIKYTGETVVPTIDVKTRLVRFSGRTGKIVSANISKTSLNENRIH